MKDLFVDNVSSADIFILVQNRLFYAILDKYSFYNCPKDAIFILLWTSIDFISVQKIVFISHFGQV